MRRDRSGERGAVLIHVAVCLLALIAFNAFVVDQGIMLVSRRQAQNAADAGALAGALALAYDDPSDFEGARVKARAAALQNAVWDGPPDVTLDDVTFPPCPPGAPGAPDTCVRVDVYRNQRPGGNPLPVFFARLLGISEQGVRATATAQLLMGDRSECVKPFAIPDKWLERRPVVKDWEPGDTFQRYQQQGANKGSLLDPADEYAPSVDGDPGTGFTVENDYGTQLTLKHGNPQQAISPGFFFPIRLKEDDQGGADYRNNIASCAEVDIGPGTILLNEPGNMVGPTKQGMQELIDLDPDAEWDATANDGQGAPVGGCMENGSCGISPRLVALPLFSPDVYDSGRTSGLLELEVTNVMGFWIERMNGNDVVGYITHYPEVHGGQTTVDDESAFLRVVILVR